MKLSYDVIVIGAGHAGCEAAVAAARLGASTLLVTQDLDRVAQMSCNPAVGGIAKGQIVREIDAIGGQMGIIADRSAIQFRMLNRSKGPAVWSPRVQSDRRRFSALWRHTLETTPGLYLLQDTVARLLIDESAPRVTGIVTTLGIEIRAQKVILTAGTFLGGLMHFGATQIPGGRISEPAAYGLTDQLRDLGLRVGRMKTGTPVRIDGRSIDYSQTEEQAGDDLVLRVGETYKGRTLTEELIVRDPHKFSFLPTVGRELRPRSCYICHTNPEAHRILHDNLDSSPLYNGQIQSIGPRYCPSIETKIVTFADKESHQLFLEPEGETTQEFYLNGFSSSLPWQVQLESLQTIPALKNVQIYRPGYAIEYDFFDPTQLTHDLQSKLVEGLYLAGQVNGTTGYEEAAGQGLMAGINAARTTQGKAPVVLGRDQAYLGVLIDDLVTKGVDEPYRMFTSRAEYRILLRQDDADMRLTPLGGEIGLATPERVAYTEKKRTLRDLLIDFCQTHKARPDQVNPLLESLHSAPITGVTPISSLLSRPAVTLPALLPLIPSLSTFINSLISSPCEESATVFGGEAPEESAAIPVPREELIEAAEILIKYSGYIARERQQADKLHRLEGVRLPAQMDYTSINALSTEARQKLSRIRPATIAQASRIPGVSPADISVLLLLMNR